MTINKSTNSILAGVISLVVTAAAQAVVITPGTCPPHRVHGHISTTPPSHIGNVSHIHHGQHGHQVAPNCPPHAPGHSPGLMPETEEGFSTVPLTFEAGLNQDGTFNGDPALLYVPPRVPRPARKGTVVQLFGSAAGFFFRDSRGEDDQRVIEFTPPVSGVPLYFTTALPEVRIGGVVAKVLFSGMAPGLTGVWQINVLVSEDSVSGRLPVTICYEGDELKSVDIVVE